jgi:formiminoglutamase
MTYRIAQPTVGRIDGLEKNNLRLHQTINYIDLESTEIELNPDEQGIVILEFAVDEGVKRNHGRDGAKDGAATITKALLNLPDHFKNKKIFHGGVITCDNCDLEKTQKTLGFYTEKALRQNCLTIVFGGGHELAFGHYLGVKNSFQQKKIGIINFDAHLDIRPINKEVGATSENSFWQIAFDRKKTDDSFNYLALGVQKQSNTKALFEIADEMKVDYVFGDEFNSENKENLLAKIENFIAENDVIYLTICMDVFASCYSPGVSTPAANGIEPDNIFKSCFDLIVKSNKCVALDFAETNPYFDTDHRTAKLAASLVFRALS